MNYIKNDKDMFTIIESNLNYNFFVGDIHGEFKSIGNWVKRNELHDCNLIFCGDFGLGFSSVQHEKSQLKKSNQICSDNNVMCYIIRGNHDDPSYYNNDEEKLNMSNIKPIHDYTIIKTQKFNILCIGGAISVDRANRIASYRHEVLELITKRHYTSEKAYSKAKLYWWEDEKFIYKQDIIDEIKKSNINIDIVATHNAPHFCQPTTNEKANGWFIVDRELEKDLYFERNDFTKLYNQLKNNGNEIAYWFYGHYHMHNYEIIEGTRFVGLDMGRQRKNNGGPGGNFDMSEAR